GAPVSFFSPRTSPREWSAAWRTIIFTPWGREAHLARCAAPRGAPLRFCAPASAETQAPGPRFPPVNRANGCYPFAGPAVQQAPCRAVLMPPGRGPEASRAQVCETCPRAPHPIPLSLTPHDSALGGPDAWTIIL